LKLASGASASPGFSQRLTSVNRVLSHILNWMGILVMLLLVLDVVWGVVTRNAVGDQAKWTEELARFLLIWVSLLGGAIALRSQDHLGIDFLVSRFESSVRKAAALFSAALVTLVIVAVLIFGGIFLVRDALMLEQSTPALGWQMGYVYLVIPLVGIFMLLFSIENILLITKTPPQTLFVQPDENVESEAENDSAE